MKVFTLEDRGSLWVFGRGWTKGSLVLAFSDETCFCFYLCSSFHFPFIFFLLHDRYRRYSRTEYHYKNKYLQLPIITSTYYGLMLKEILLSYKTSQDNHQLPFAPVFDGVLSNSTKAREETVLTNEVLFLARQNKGSKCWGRWMELMFRYKTYIYIASHVPRWFIPRYREDGELWIKVIHTSTSDHSVAIVFIPRNHIAFFYYVNTTDDR